MDQLRPDLIGFKALFVWHYLLLDDDDDITALDTGFGAAHRSIQKWFRETGRRPERLTDVLLTHGHLDHAGCAERLRAWSGAVIRMHPADKPIVDGRGSYPGWSAIGGLLERIGRPLTLYRPPTSFEPLADGMALPNWGGLRVIHLPGHTAGHCGFYSEAKRILFIGDSILSSGDRALFPAPIFNADGRELRRSLARTLDLDVEFVYPMHHRKLTTNLAPAIARLLNVDPIQTRQRRAES
jgi:glyoxylase-like metal-dependent hydrolase (beta-lactamase superfamily II)